MNSTSRASALRPGAVLFAKDMQAVAGFYRAVGELTEDFADEHHIVLVGTHFELVVHALPGDIAEEILIETPPRTRVENPHKISLPVTSLEAARELATASGGRLAPEPEEWTGRGYRACEGYDPEGNPVQVRALRST